MIFFATKSDLEKVQQSNIDLRQRLYTLESKLFALQQAVLLPETGHSADIIPIKQAFQCLLNELGYTLTIPPTDAVTLVKKV